MTTSIATQAFELWVETLALETTDINTESAKWHDLYSKECRLFSLLRQFTPEDSMLYAQLICEWKARVEEMYKDTDPNLADSI